jgi:phosphonate transport system substrate-binding protein
LILKNIRSKESFNGETKMNGRLTLLMLALLGLISINMTACKQPGTTPGEPPVTAPGAGQPIGQIGSADHPIKLVFSPSAQRDVIISRGQVMADAIQKATGLSFEVRVPDSYSGAIKEMCASPTDTMGFLTGLGYVLAHQMCGVDVSLKAVRSGYDVFWTEILVPRDSQINSLEDLNGKRWGYGDPGFTTDYLVPITMFNEAGVAPGKQLQTGSHRQSLLALYYGEVDFVTTYYGPPTDVQSGKVVWSKDNPDISDDLVGSCSISEYDKSLICGNLRIHDARASIRATTPDVVQKLRILAISPDIPNDTISFGPRFPTDLRVKIEEALEQLAQTEAWSQSIGSEDFYNWTGITTARDAEYDILRDMVAATWPELGKP